jgi:8-oxo-dGTP pyrophosphatase MutT (NUDIX family)
VLDRTRAHAVLIHHRKLNRWLQPGGHVEDADTSWREAARREVTEETGLSRFIAQRDDDDVFDVDVHPIPPRKDEPAHFHYDLRFLFVADVDAGLGDRFTLNTDEAYDCRWFRLIDLANDPALEPSLRRMVELSIHSFR